MKHTYTEEEKEKIAQLLFEWLIEHDCWGSEKVYQVDYCNLDSVDLVAKLADIKNVIDNE
jgi:hypothetical protein